MTYDELAALLPDAAIELAIDGKELVIWTGLAVDPADPKGELVDFDNPRLLT